MDLLLHPQTKERYEYFAADPPQSILLIGPKGSGKTTLLASLAAEIAGEHAAGRIMTLEPEPEKMFISIEQIRDLKTMLRLKSSEPRIILIPNAELVTSDAQNSFLKLLEEPPQMVHFFMAAEKPSDVLETIQSRTVVWRLVLPSKAQIADYFTEYEPAKVQKAIAISGGRVGLISALLAEDGDHELIQAIDTAKELLAESKFERILRVDALSKDTAQTVVVLDALELTTKAALEQAASKNAHTVRQWHKRALLVSEAKTMLDKRVSSKLVLDWLFIKL